MLRFSKNAAVCGRQEKYVAKYVHEVRIASRNVVFINLYKFDRLRLRT